MPQIMDNVWKFWNLNISISFTYDLIIYTNELIAETLDSRSGFFVKIFIYIWDGMKIFAILNTNIVNILESENNKTI